MNKKPWLAVILNVLLTGLGYIYAGKRKLFGVMLLVGELAAIAWALKRAGAVRGLECRSAAYGHYYSLDCCLCN